MNDLILRRAAPSDMNGLLQLQLDVFSGEQGIPSSMMENREADLCLYSGGEQRDFEWIPLFQDQLLALMPPGHPLTELESVPINALMNEQFIMAEFL